MFLRGFFENGINNGFMEVAYNTYLRISNPDKQTGKK